jgi:hypothetical protein
MDYDPDVDLQVIALRNIGGTTVGDTENMVGYLLLSCS